MTTLADSDLRSCSSSEELLANLGAKVLVTDFDGTMTGVDFYEVVLNHVPADGMPDYWGRCLAGELSHVGALNGIFQHAPQEATTLRSWLPEAQLDPRTSAAVDLLKAAGWDTLVVSAGCEWYIREILADLKGKVQLIANPGDIAPDSGLWMGWPPEHVPWYSAHFGIDKARIVRLLVDSGRTVAFAGDGRPDLAAAREVRPPLRFARSWLAEQLQQGQEDFERFEQWSDIAPVLARQT